MVASRLSFIRRVRGLGFALDEVRALLRLADGREPCDEVKDVAVAHLADVRWEITDLQAIEAALEMLVAKCADGKAPVGPLIETLSNDQRALEAMAAHPRAPAGST